MKVLSEDGRLLEGKRSDESYAVPALLGLMTAWWVIHGLIAAYIKLNAAQTHLLFFSMTMGMPAGLFIGIIIYTAVTNVI